MCYSLSLNRLADTKQEKDTRDSANNLVPRVSLSPPPEREKRDPGWVWSRAPQNLGGDRKIVDGRGGLECFCQY